MFAAWLRHNSWSYKSCSVRHKFIVSKFAGYFTTTRATTAVFFCIKSSHGASLSESICQRSLQSIASGRRATSYPRRVRVWSISICDRIATVRRSAIQSAANGMKHYSAALSTGWSKKLHKVYGTIILQPYITESSGFQQNVLKEILYMT